MTDEHKDVLMQTLKRKLPLNPFKIRVDFKLTCTTYDGIEIIKEALLAAKHAVNDEEWNLDFKLIAPPIYKCEVVTLSRNQGEEKLKQALAIIKKVMKKNSGKFEQSGPPTVLGVNKDEQELSELIE
jgi:translation initiation factor 2 subunit 1